jgi:DNA damage-inducible protein 1
MLYINASINKVPIQAFVDSGAQSTVMSQSLAEKCGVMRLVDKRYSGTAVGVGNCKILGRVHAA